MAWKTPTEKHTLDSITAKLRPAGFEVTDAGSKRIRVQKGRYAAVLEETPEGIRFAEPPGFLIGAHIARLIDRGYQKYLMTPEIKIPANAEHLKGEHEFAMAMRAALGIPSLYNEALGTVSDRYLYDRVAGRGDAPPQGVYGTTILRNQR